MSEKRKSTQDLRSMKGKEKISALTAYDYQMACMLDNSGIDLILVGDSLGNVVLGFENTLPVTVEYMIHHTKAVARGIKNAFLVADMPFQSFQVSDEATIDNACSLLKAGAQAVKLEGGVTMANRIKRLVEIGIPVMGHVGLTPQSINQLGNYSIQGKDEITAGKIIEDAKAVEKAGAFAIVLECVTPKVAAEITSTLTIPTVGIGSGDQCDGQILVTNDLIGLTVSPVPKFVKTKLNLRSMIEESVMSYVKDIKGE